MPRAVRREHHFVARFRTFTGPYVNYYRLKAVALGTKGPRILVVKSITPVMLSFTREPLTPCTLVAKKSTNVFA
jgi:hypothetical protein